MAWGMKKLDAIEKRTENNFEEGSVFLAPVITQPIIT